MSEITLPKRTKKPRTFGITSVHDVRLSVGELRNILIDFHDYIDVAKLGIGAAYVTPTLKEKLEVYREFDVIPHLGGTLFERFYYEKKLDAYLKYHHDLGINWIEVSDGTIEIPLDDRIRLVERLKKDFVVITEVGCKDANTIATPTEWIEEIKALLEAGSTYVITEGRDSGTAGVYRGTGEIRSDLISDIAHAVDPKKIIFEAPQDKGQMYFINLIGPNVNLGNVSPLDLLLLEAQRNGLRNETFFITEKHEDCCHSSSSDALEPRGLAPRQTGPTNHSA